MGMCPCSLQTLESTHIKWIRFTISPQNETREKKSSLLKKLEHQIRRPCVMMVVQKCISFLQSELICSNKSQIALQFCFELERFVWRFTLQLKDII